MKRIKIIVILIAILFLCAVAALYAGLIIRNDITNTRCLANLTNLRRATYGNPKVKSGMEIRELFASDPNLYLFKCPACNRTYSFSFVTPSGHIIKEDNDHGNYLIAWCPEPCHDGKRNILFSSLGVYGNHYSDDQISWYYQKLMQDLSPEEKAKEVEYRKATKIQSK